MKALVMQVLGLLEKIDEDNKYVIFDEIGRIVSGNEKYLSFKVDYHINFPDYYSFVYVDDDGNLKQETGIVY